MFTLISSARDYNIGDIETFWQLDVLKAEKVLADGYYMADFQCIRKGKYSYVFLERALPDDKVPDIDFVDKLFVFFEQIYPKLTDYFGPPSDLDKNERFSILIADIRDWFYYDVNTKFEAQPIQGYYSFELNLKDKKDFLTMDVKQSIVDAYGTLANQYFKNIFENANPNPDIPKDRAIQEALAHISIFLAGTVDRDSYIQWQISILKKDLEKGKLLNPFDSTYDYLDIQNPDIHHCYAAGYFFMYYIINRILSDRHEKREFIYSLIYEKINSDSYTKIMNSLIKSRIILDERSFNIFYRNNFKEFLLEFLGIQDNSLIQNN